MDVSKLPKLSDTQKEQRAETRAAAADAAPQAVKVLPHEMDYAGKTNAIPAVGGADAWLSIAIGVILLLMNSRFLQYVFARSSFTWTFNDAAGNPLPYTKTVFFWGDFALVAFAVVLIVEGLVLGLAPRKWLIVLALVLTVATTLLNFGYVAYMMGSYGFQMMSALAVAFGVYIAMFEWRLLKFITRDTAPAQ
jgi:uncharacterized protein YjeT (DUF2065 family)